jgi:hypothetical protein
VPLKSHPKFASNNEFYAFIDAITAKLRKDGFTSDAERLHELIHRIAWTTSTELFGELRIALRQTLKEHSGLASHISSDIRHAIKVITKALHPSRL